MASIVNDPGGRRRILFVGDDDRRKAIRLGKIDRKTAEVVARHVEALVTFRSCGRPVPRETTVWLEGVGPKVRNRLVAVGLVEPVHRLTINEYLDMWLAGKKAAGHKPTSMRAWKQTSTAIQGQFGKKLLSTVTHADGESFRAAMQNRDLRDTTVHKRLGHARQMLEDAVRLGHLEVNPWRHVRHRGGDPSDRRRYVTVDEVEKVIENCPSIHWRLLVALSRFGGLRVPSEAFLLRRTDLDWKRGRLRVPSPKTEGKGKPVRVIPIFPLLRPYLEEAIKAAGDGNDYIFPEEWRQRANGDGGWGGVNMRTTLTKIVVRAGLKTWPRIWHALRSSCESDLAQSFPLATVVKWLGNTVGVAMRHYVDATDEAFDRALDWRPAKGSGAKSGAQTAQNPAQRGAARNRDDSQYSSQDQWPEGATRNTTTCDETLREGQRECMGIEPTESVVHTPRWF